MTTVSLRFEYDLDNRVIPCRNNGQATRKYAIRARDAITFLRLRDTFPASKGFCAIANKS